MVKFNPGLSLSLGKVLLAKNMQLEFTKYIVESLFRDTIKITQNVTLSST